MKIEIRPEELKAAVDEYVETGSQMGIKNFLRQYFYWTAKAALDKAITDYVQSLNNKE